MASIALATTADEIARCFPVMRQLRPHLREETFLARVHEQFAEGYQLACLEDHGEIVAVGGFRIFGLLATGRTLYIDDLVTDEGGRSRGHGKALLAWIEDYARQQGCDTLSLDSGTHRQDAHAFYLRERMRITSFHFAKKLR